MLSGCAESVRQQYAELGDWNQPKDVPNVISGSPNADRAALEDSEAVLSDADWKTLEEISPAAIWERIGVQRKRRQVQEMDQEAVKEAALPEIDVADVSPDEPESVISETSPIELDNMTVTELADGRLRVVYTLQNHGGVEAKPAAGKDMERRTINVTRTDLAPFVNIINQNLGDKGACTALPNGTAVVITCPKENREIVLHLLRDFDQPASQVEIAARIFEVSHDFDFQFGSRTVLEHITSDGGQNLASTFDTKAFLDGLSNPGVGDTAYQGSAMQVFQVFKGAGISVDITFQALVDAGMVKEVASPRMTVIAGHTGSMIAGKEIPINSARLANDNLISEVTTYKPVGVQLYVTPQSISENSVKLHVLTVVSSVAGFDPRQSLMGQDSLQNIVNPIFNTREAQTSVTVPDGTTLVVGGLRMVRQIQRERKIPGLGDIWGLEWLFKSHRSQRNISDLYFFITPNIVHSPEPA